LKESGGIWFGNYETPAILSNIGKIKVSQNKKLSKSSYGRKESEGKDYNEDTNFGKLKRIPYKELQLFLKKNRCKLYVCWNMSIRLENRLTTSHNCGLNAAPEYRLGLCHILFCANQGRRQAQNKTSFTRGRYMTLIHSRQPK